MSALRRNTRDWLNVGLYQKIMIISQRSLAPGSSHVKTSIHENQYAKINHGICPRRLECYATRTKMGSRRSAALEPLPFEVDTNPDSQPFSQTFSKQSARQPGRTGPAQFSTGETDRESQIWPLSSSLASTPTAASNVGRPPPSVGKPEKMRSRCSFFPPPTATIAHGAS